MYRTISYSLGKDTAEATMLCCAKECLGMGFRFECDAVASLLSDLMWQTQLPGRCDQSTLSCIRSPGVVKSL